MSHPLSWNAPFPCPPSLPAAFSGGPQAERPGAWAVRWLAGRRAGQMALLGAQGAWAELQMQGGLAEWALGSAR